MILQRSPSAEEITAQLNAWRWPATRSDFLLAMSQCPEAGDEITLAGLGRRVMQLFRRIKSNRKHVNTFPSSGDSEVPRLYESLTHLTDQVKTGEKLALLRSEQVSSLNRQVAAMENTLSRLEFEWKQKAPRHPKLPPIPK